MTERLELAKALARFYHVGQKYGQHDYFEKHLEEVAEQVREMTYEQYLEDAEIVAYLHDILEDTPCQYGMICSLFGSVIADAVLAITKRRLESKADYLLRCKGNVLARIVKVADSNVNAKNCALEGHIEKFQAYMRNVIFLNEDYLN